MACSYTWMHLIAVPMRAVMKVQLGRFLVEGVLAISEFFL